MGTSPQLGPRQSTAIERQRGCTAAACTICQLSWFSFISLPNGCMLLLFLQLFQESSSVVTTRYHQHQMRSRNLASGKSSWQSLLREMKVSGNPSRRLYQALLYLLSMQQSKPSTRKSVNGFALCVRKRVAARTSWRRSANFTAHISVSLNVVIAILP